jgi:hypothetical protein
MGRRVAFLMRSGYCPTCPRYEAALLLLSVELYEWLIELGLLVMGDVGRDPVDDVVLLTAREL